jgi:hypothetical protein
VRVGFARASQRRPPIESLRARHGSMGQEARKGLMSLWSGVAFSSWSLLGVSLALLGSTGLTQAPGMELDAMVVAQVEGAAMESAPPAVGDLVMEDPLTGSSLAGYRTVSRNGRNVSEPVGEGRIIKVSGPTTSSTTQAALTDRINFVTVPDGEIRVEFKLVSGYERARIRLWFRDQGRETESYVAEVDPASGHIQLRYYSYAGPDQVLAERSELAELFSPDDWNTLAVRLRGNELWALIGETPVLWAADPRLSSGEVLLGLRRLGSTEDTEESAVVFRNLRVSALADGEPTRVPTYVPQEPQPPRVGRIYFSTERDGSRRAETDTGVMPASIATIHAFVDHFDVVPPHVVRVLAAGRRACPDRPPALHTTAPGRLYP